MYYLEPRGMPPITPSASVGLGPNQGSAAVASAWLDLGVGAALARPRLRFPVIFQSKSSYQTLLKCEFLSASPTFFFFGQGRN